ncbi:unnamed protein product (macronuclear) [Paramecium tetraurelia]|uniref:Transmembrane protein n=1 Tax=Paramecium tetraurelia TaxID=5888 RepID=A0E5C7_PARTE|nr:uncharacterized protein GSPATT00023671001 [Paramecium tetraurelia]CAK90494.1 unnamed protein product [Paramecium tetraurelia]|eukprot:XP_001457891.1 hypothetical protein (macronuclear) [Paramecium tetraurelia strain d4-2]
MIIFLLGIVTVFGDNIKNLSDYAIILNQTQEIKHYDLEINEEAVLFQYPQGSILKSSITSDNKTTLCGVNHDYISITTNISKQIIKQDQEMYTTLSDQIIAAINKKTTMGFVTEQNNYIEFDFISLDIKNTMVLNSHMAQTQIYQSGIYSIETNLTILFYTKTVLILDDTNNVVSQNITQMEINEVLSSLGYLYVATKKGLMIYKIDPTNKAIIFNQTIEDKQHIIDIALGGENGEILYMLKNDGIHIYQITKDGLLTKHPNLSIIPIDYGIAFDQDNDESLSILIRPQKHVIFVDIEINLDKGVWLLESQHKLKINAEEVYINGKYAILRGVDTHNIIRHSLPNIFTVSIQSYTQRIFNNYPFMLSNAVLLGFHELNIEHQDDTVHNWYKNSTKNILYGVDPNQIVLYQWQNFEGQISCYTEDETLIGQTFVYDVQATLSECDQKNEYKDDIVSKDLLVCQFQTKLYIKVLEDIQSYQQNILIIICAALGGALILSILVFACYRRKTQSQLIQFKEQIKKYEKFQGEGSESHGIRQDTPHPPAHQIVNNFKIDDDDQ